MNPLFSRMTERYTPKMNRSVMEGLACQALKSIEEYLDGQIRSAVIGLPPSVSYLGYERCTSQEEYEEITRPRNSRRSFDLADTSIYLVRYNFQFVDEQGVIHPIVRNIQLPFTRPGALITISGKSYRITPVLSNKIFTPNHESIFVRLMQDRNNFYRIYHTVTINGKRETRYVIWATIYRNPAANKRETRIKTTVVHYLFAKYGFTEAFRRYVGAVPVYGDEKDITQENYPRDTWTIIESMGRPGTATDAGYQKTRIRLAVRNEDWSPSMESMIFGFFYTLDHFPNRFRPEPRYLDDKPLWMILIGLIFFGREFGENKVFLTMKDHFETIDPYLDLASKQKLEERGIFLENYYDLLNYIRVNFNEMVLSNDLTMAGLYGKNLEVLYYVLYGLLYGFAMVKFKLNKVIGHRPLTLKDVTENLRRYVKMGEVFSLPNKSIAVEMVSYGGDHLFPRLTSVIEDQENHNVAGRQSSDYVAVGARNRISPDEAVVGSILAMPKSNPTPMARINPWIILDEKTATVMSNPDFMELIDRNRQFFKL